MLGCLCALVPEARPLDRTRDCEEGGALLTCMTQSKSSTEPPSSWPYSLSRDPPCDMAHSIQRSWMQLDHQNARPTTSLADSAAASTALHSQDCPCAPITPAATSISSRSARMTP
jgi:hypothetical protein